MNAKCCAYDTYAKGFALGTGSWAPLDESWLELIINHCRAAEDKNKQWKTIAERNIYFLAFFLFFLPYLVRDSHCITMTMEERKKGNLLIESWEIYVNLQIEIQTRSQPKQWHAHLDSARDKEESGQGSRKRRH